MPHIFTKIYRSRGLMVKALVFGWEVSAPRTSPEIGRSQVITASTRPAHILTALQESPRDRIFFWALLNPTLPLFLLY